MGMLGDLGKSALKGLQDYSADMDKRVARYEGWSDEALLKRYRSGTGVWQERGAMRIVLKRRGIIDDD